VLGFSVTLLQKSKKSKHRQNIRRKSSSESSEEDTPVPEYEVMNISYLRLDILPTLEHFLLQSLHSEQ